MRRARAAAALASTLVLVAAAGCGEAAFSAHARDNDPGDLAHALARSTAPEGHAGHPMAFLVTEGHLIGYDLGAARIAWDQPADVRSRVVVGAGALAHRQGDRELVVRASDTGAVRATVTLGEGEVFVGAALDGDRLVYVVQTADKRAAVAAVGFGGGAQKELWRVSTPSALGAPAVRGGLVALPFAHQNLVLLDAGNGHELARVRATDEAISYVRALPEGIFYGGARGVYRLDDKSVSGSRGGSSYAEARLAATPESPQSEGQVRTAYSWDGYQPAQAAIGAFDRNRLLWRGRDVGAGFHDDLAVLHTYRFFFAFDARAGKLRWVYAHPRTDVAASEDLGSAIVFASADGDVGLIDPTSGAVRVVARTGLRVAGASFDADGLSAGATGPAPTPAEVARTLESIVWDHDARFAAVKVFAVEALGGVPGVEVSTALLKIVRAQPGPASSGPSPAAVKQAGEVLVARKDRALVPALLAALGERYDFLDDKQPHGIDVLARAVAALEVKEAAPLLAARLDDHETPESALADVVAALAALATNGTPEATRALSAFVLEYHADPELAADPAPLVRAAQALVKEGGAEAHRAAVYVAEDPRTLAPVRKELHAALDAAAADKARTEPQSAPEKTPEKAPDRPATASPPATAPTNPSGSAPTNPTEKRTPEKPE